MWFTWNVPWLVFQHMADKNMQSDGLSIFYCSFWMKHWNLVVSVPRKLWVLIACIVQGSTWHLMSKSSIVFKIVKNPHPQGPRLSVKFLRSGEKKRANAPSLFSRAFPISDFNSKTLYWFVVVLRSRLSRILFLTLRSLQISFRIFILLIFIYLFHDP